jgi:hypothetical protein
MASANELIAFVGEDGEALFACARACALRAIL